MAELLQSPTALARALADTQTVVGHDGVLCVYDPGLIATACIGQQREATGLQSAISAGFLQTPPLMTLLESIQPLQHHLQQRALVIVTIAGPALLCSQLQKMLQSGGGDSRVDPDHVSNVIRTVVRSALESKADGIALIEQTAPDSPEEFLRCYKTVRKLADFYDVAYLAFRLAAAGVQPPDMMAHCVFDLAADEKGLGPVRGKPGPGTASNVVPFTTAGDVSESITVEELKDLSRKILSA